MLDLIETRLRHLNDRPIERLKGPAPSVGNAVVALAGTAGQKDELPPSRQSRPQA
jgi:hypothetical protein